MHLVNCHAWWWRWLWRVVRGRIRVEGPRQVDGEEDNHTSLRRGQAGHSSRPLPASTPTSQTPRTHHDAPARSLLGVEEELGVGEEKQPRRSRHANGWLRRQRLPRLGGAEAAALAAPASHRTRRIRSTRGDAMKPSRNRCGAATRIWDLAIFRRIIIG